MKILIAGGSGLIGTALKQFWSESGHDVKICSRSHSGDDIIRWNPAKYDVISDEKFDAVINLSGAGIADEKWTKERKAEIQESRIRSIETLDRYFQRVDFTPEIFINASAIGIYGHSDEHIFTEEDKAFNEDFLVQTCQLWENKVAKMITKPKLTYIARFGVVLSNEGGAFPQLSQGKALGIIPHLGTGSQFISWIHINDVVGVFDHFFLRKPEEGIYNLTAPSPVTNKEMADQIADRKGLGLSPKVPQFVVKTMFGKRSIIVLNSTRVSSTKLEDTGFGFRYRNIDLALDQLLA